MLRSVGDLLRYIDENHLTSDFTAKVEYCQSDWIVLRTVTAHLPSILVHRAPKDGKQNYLFTFLRLFCAQAIETFAVTVKDIAQVLQGFGSELSETELPDEANAIEFLLHSHTHRYRQMKVLSRDSSLRRCLVHSHPGGCVVSRCCFAALFQDDIRNVLKEGRLLLTNLETVKASKRDAEDERDIKADMDTVQR